MASSSGATEAQIRSEIERLTGYVVRFVYQRISHEYLTAATIKEHKELQKQQASRNGHYGHYGHQYPGPGQARSNKYVNPNYQAPNKFGRPGIASAPNAATPVAVSSESGTLDPQIGQPPPVIPGQKKDVVLGGVAFESSGRSLVRKDCESWVCVCVCSLFA